MIVMPSSQLHFTFVSNQNFYTDIDVSSKSLKEFTKAKSPTNQTQERSIHPSIHSASIFQRHHQTKNAENIPSPLQLLPKPRTSSTPLSDINRRSLSSTNHELFNSHPPDPLYTEHSVHSLDYCVCVDLTTKASVPGSLMRTPVLLPALASSVAPLSLSFATHKTPRPRKPPPRDHPTSMVPVSHARSEIPVPPHLPSPTLSLPFPTLSLLLLTIVFRCKG